MFTNMGMVLSLFKWKKDPVKRNRLKQDFLSRIRRNNSLTLDRIFTKFASCTSSTPNENSAKFKVNRTETIGGVVRTSIFKSNQGQ